VLNPDILLLDEPLSNLDAKIRVAGPKRDPQAAEGSRITTVYVTHDQEEALSMSDRVAVMREGPGAPGGVTQGALRAAGRSLRRRLRRDEQLLARHVPRRSR